MCVLCVLNNSSVCVCVYFVFQVVGLRVYTSSPVCVNYFCYRLTCVFVKLLFCVTFYVCTLPYVDSIPVCVLFRFLFNRYLCILPVLCNRPACTLFVLDNRSLYIRLPVLCIKPLRTIHVLGTSSACSLPLIIMCVENSRIQQTPGHTHTCPHTHASGSGLFMK